jgi:hypothetical protein
MRWLIPLTFVACGESSAPVVIPTAHGQMPRAFTDTTIIFEDEASTSLFEQAPTADHATPIIGGTGLIEEVAWKAGWLGWFREDGGETWLGRRSPDGNVEEVRLGSNAFVDHVAAAPDGVAFTGVATTSLPGGSGLPALYWL